MTDAEALFLTGLRDLCERSDALSVYAVLDVIVHKHDTKNAVEALMARNRLSRADVDSVLKRYSLGQKQWNWR
jgi:hypothetical protein